MKILSVHIENFGKLHDYDRDFTGGVNVITENNGWGKTTMSVFLLVMFYGFDDKLTRKYREKYAPWGGGTYGGSIVFETGGKNYLVERTFGHRKTMDDTFTLRDADTNLVCDDFDEYLGDELFKINTESFMKTVFIGTGNCITATTDDINAKIGDLSLVEADMRSYSDAKGRLNDLINRNSDIRKTGKIYGMKEKAAELRNKARFAKGIRNELGDYENKLKQLSDEEKELEVKKNDLINLQSNIVRCKEASLYYDRYKALFAAVEAAKRAQEEEFGESIVPGIAMMVSGGLIFLGGVALMIFVSLIGGILLLVAGLVLLVMGFVTYYRRERRFENWDIARDEACEKAEQEYLSFVNSIDVKEIRELAFRPEANMSLKETEKKRSDTTERLETVRNDIRKLAVRREFLCDELISAESCEAKADDLTKKIKEETLRLENAKRAAALLEEAKAGFALHYLEPLKKSLADYLGMLKENSDVRFHMDANLELTMEEAGKQRKEEAFSDGIRDALGLCMRFALIDAMYPAERPFVIMDDPFIHLDNATYDAARKLLEKVPYQIILMQKE